MLRLSYLWEAYIQTLYALVTLYPSLKMRHRQNNVNELCYMKGEIKGEEPSY